MRHFPAIVEGIELEHIFDMIRKQRLRIAALFIIGAVLNGCSFIKINPRPGTSSTECSDTVQNAGAQTQLPVSAVTDDSLDTGTVDALVTEKGPDAEQSARDALSALRKADFDGMNFLIAAVDTSAAFGTDAADEILRNDTLYTIRSRRTEWVEEKYNAHILVFPYDADELFREVSQAYLSETQYVADFYVIPPEQLGKYQQNDLLFNLRSLPFTDYTQPYFNQDAMQQMSAGYGIWGAAGDLTEAPENLWGVYFNKKLIEKMEAVTPYLHVKDGTWTWDVLFAYAKQAEETLDGIVGYAADLLDIKRGEALLYASADLHIAETALDQTPVIRNSRIPDKMQKIADIVYQNLFKKTASDSDGTSADAETCFVSGKQLFYIGDLSHVPAWADISTDWGLVPLPKIFSEQKQYTGGTGDAAILCVPSVTGAPEKTGMILQAMFAASYDAYADAFLNDALAYYVRDEETVEMLDLIMDHVSYDFTAMFASGYEALYAATFGALHLTVTTANSYKTLYERSLDTAKARLLAAFPTNR